MLSKKECMEHFDILYKLNPYCTKETFLNVRDLINILDENHCPNQIKYNKQNEIILIYDNHKEIIVSKIDIMLCYENYSTRVVIGSYSRFDQEVIYKIKSFLEK